MTEPSCFRLSASPEEASFQWERFVQSYEKDRRRLFKPDRDGLFLRLFGNSRFLASFLMNHPEVVDPVLSSPFLGRIKPSSQFLLEASKVVPTLLKRYKYQELLRITLKDLSPKRNDEGILQELSSLALAVLTVVGQRVYNETSEKWGAPLLASGKKCGHQIVALGKLGGFELNYSSDIDLLVVVESDDGATENDLSLHEFFVRFAQNLTTALQSKGPDGFFYRVDWDLRPEGKAGTLVNSLAALEYYYETFGADWERQALIRARPVLGSQTVSRRFNQMVSPFVYRRHLDLKAVQQVGLMKQRIQEETIKKKENGFNVKLGPGGIREAEFFVQSFLLLHGGREKKLRERNTLKALKALSALRILSKPDAEALSRDYLFLRKVEHRLQMEDEQQTHLLPADEDQQTKVARRMGYADVEPEKALARFRDDLSGTTLRVERLFDSLFATRTFYSVGSRPLQRIAPVEDRISDETNELRQRLQHKRSLEESIDEIRWFKKEKRNAIEKLERDPKIPRREILERLSFLACSVCEIALERAAQELVEKYGSPMADRLKNLNHPSELAAIGMGKLGGAEINYHSDLDLIFIFSHHGETNGAMPISNTEYFARLVQKFIFLLSVPTRAGYAYQVDSSLRPSGKAGMLVTNLESFMEYQKNVSQVWERQALLRAQPVVGPNHLCGLIDVHLKALLFSAPSPREVGTEMNRLRTRVERELAHERDDIFDFKLGRGSLMDIEFILHYHQLRFGSALPSLTTRNTFDGLDAMIQLNLLSTTDHAVLLKEAYTFYRTLESKLSLRLNRSAHRLSATDENLVPLAEELGFRSARVFLKQYDSLRDRVRKIYDEVFKRCP